MAFGHGLNLLNASRPLLILNKYFSFYYEQAQIQSQEFYNVISPLEKEVRNTPEVQVKARNFTGKNSFQKCPFPWTHFYICWNGFVPPCCAKPFPKELNFGNVFNSKVISVLNSKEFRTFRTSWYEDIPPAFCKNCHFIHIEPINSHF